jgi:hypothetical protein
MGLRLSSPLILPCLWQISSKTMRGNPTMCSKEFIIWWRCSRSESRSWTELTIVSRRSTRLSTGKAKRKSLSRVTWCSSGMHPGRKRANTVNLMPSGSGLSISLKCFQTTLTGCRIWKAMKFLMAQSMGIS